MAQTVILNCAKMSLGEIKGLDTGGSWLLFVSDASCPPPKARDHEEPCKSAGASVQKSRMHARWLSTGHLRRLTPRPAALAMRAVVIVPSGFPPLARPVKGTDLQLKPRPYPCLQHRRRHPLAQGKKHCRENGAKRPCAGHTELG